MALTLHELKPSLIVYKHTSPILLPATSSIRMGVLWQFEQSRSLIYTRGLFSFHVGCFSDRSGYRILLSHITKMYIA